jgi:beta-lactamase regulating signal transducer with metallopeptidase domain
MMMLTDTSAATSVLALLANSAVRSLVLASAAGLGLAVFRIRSTAARLFTWRAVLYASLAMPVLQSMLPPVSVPTPRLLQSRVEQPVVPGLFPSSPYNVALERNDAGRAASSSATTRSSHLNSTTPPHEEALPIALRHPDSQSYFSSLPDSFLASISWSVVAVGIYFGGALLLLARFVVGLAFGGRLLQASQPIYDRRVAARVASRAQAMGLASLPQVAESELISVPLTIGVLRPTILLPPGWPEWDEARLDAVVAHEMSHVSRRDTLTQRLALLHRAIFWFSPLAWWLDGHLADLAEQASDEVALLCGANRTDYAKTLLEFFEALHAAPGRVWWQGVAMAKAGQAEKRLERILNWKGSVAMRLQKSIAVVILALAVPLIYFVASVHAASQSIPLRSASGQDQTPPSAPRPAPAPQAEPAAAPEADSTPPPEPASQSEPAPLAPSIPGAVSAGIRGGVGGGIGPVPPVRGFAAVAPIAPMAPSSSMSALPPLPRGGWHGQSSQSGSSSHRGYSYAYGYDDQQRFVIVSGKTDAFTMSGSDEDARHVEKLRKTIPGDFIWFQRDEKSYVIRDQATIDRARKLWAPQEELGKKQEELGKQQEALGKQQEELGAKMEQVHVSVPDMTAELDKLKAELKKLSSGATVEQVGEIQSEIGDLQSKIGDIQSKAGDQQGHLGEQMGALGESKANSANSKANWAASRANWREKPHAR